MNVKQITQMRWSLPLGVCDLLVLHWNVEVNPERIQNYLKELD